MVLAKKEDGELEVSLDRISIRSGRPRAECLSDPCRVDSVSGRHCGSHARTYGFVSALVRRPVWISTHSHHHGNGLRHMEPVHRNWNTDTVGTANSGQLTLPGVAGLNRWAERSGVFRTRNQSVRMTRIQLLTKEALSLTDVERAVLAAELLQTLPAVLAEEDEGIAEALRRDLELDADPSAGIEWSVVKKELGR